MTRIRQRTDTAANWTSVNPVLLSGEVGWESDTRRAKIGNGTTAWNNLLYEDDEVRSSLQTVIALLGQTRDDVADLEGAVALKAPLKDAALTGNPTAPTPPVGDDDTSIATTAFVKGAMDRGFAGTALGTADLNTITTAGIYRQDSPTQATVARNYPRDNMGAVLEVLKINNENLEQRLTMVIGTSTTNAVTYIRRLAYGVWGTWRTVPSQRVDNTAGRAIYTWDDTANREQLIYGDTGWRDISALLENGWTLGSGGFARLRRVGQMVSLRFSLINPASATGTTVLNLPPGFRTSVPEYTIMRPSAGGSFPVGSVSNALVSLVTNAGPGNGGNDFLTSDPWPTALPGTPFGSIPNL